MQTGTVRGGVLAALSLAACDVDTRAPVIDEVLQQAPAALPSDGDAGLLAPRPTRDGEAPTSGADASTEAASASMQQEEPRAAPPAPQNDEGVGGSGAAGSGEAMGADDVPSPEPAPPVSAMPPVSAPPMSAPALPPELLQSGAVCADARECVSGVCEDARCCERPCGTCEACLGSAGTCIPVVDGVDADTCTAPRLCGANTACLTPDQAQPSSSSNILLAGASVSRFAQIVLPARSGQLSELLLAVLCLPGTATLELQGVTAEQPNGIVSFRLDRLVPDGSRTRIPIEPPVPVQAGFPFAIVLGGTTGESCSVSVESGDPYPRGAAFIEDPRAPGTWFPIATDMSFETRVAQ